MKKKPTTVTSEGIFSPGSKKQKGKPIKIGGKKTYTGSVKPPKEK